MEQIDPTDLIQEIRYLKGLLDANGIAYDYQAYRESQRIAEEEDEIELPELTREHAIAFYSMFRGRKDVFAKRSAKKGYFTQCDNFWKYGVCPKRNGIKVKCRECPQQQYTKLTIPLLLEHLKGEREDCTDVIGLYPLFPDGTCWFLVFDFDNHADEDVEPSKDWQQEVDALRRICELNGIDALVERSRSGRGAHVWIFFSEAVQAAKARRFGEALIVKGAESVSMKDFSFFDRMLPMQDSLPDGKIGNMVALPLQGKALRAGNSAFVDGQWHPYRDQWEHLLHTNKLSESQIDKYVSDWCPTENAMSVFQSDTEEASTPSLFGRVSRPSLGQFRKEDVEGKMNIVLSDGIYIDKRNLKSRIQNGIRRIAAFSNSQFFINLKMGFSNQDTPRIVYAGYDEGDYIVLPRGCMDDLKILLDDAEIDYTVTDRRQIGRTLDVTFNGSLYPEQTQAAEKMLHSDNGVLAAATAFGKTVVGAYLIAQRRVNTLVLVHNVEIMQNWVRDLSQFLTINEPLPTYTTPKGRIKQRLSLIGTFSSQKDTSTRIIDIAMITSLGRDDEIHPMVQQYGMVIVDECHHIAAYTHENVLRAVIARYVYGMTATAKRMDGQTKKIFMQLGPIRHRYTAKEHAEKQGIGHFVYPRFTRLVDMEGKGDRHISEYFDMVCKSEMRNMQIVNDVVDCVNKGRTPVVMTKYREHAQMLYARLEGAADHVFLLQGGGSMKSRAAIRQQMLAVNKDETMIVVAIGQYIGEGFNFPRLDTMLLAMPISFEVNVEQYAGRLNRDYEGKNDVIIFDYIDQHIPKLERMYHKRLRTYKKIGFEVCADVVDKQEVANSIFDCSNYLAAFERDILAATSRIVVSSPSLSARKVQHFMSLVQDKGISAVIFSREPETYPEDGREHQRELISRLQNAGIRVIPQNCCYERYAVMDDAVVWYGSMNLLSNEKDDDNVMRLMSPPVAAELMEVSAGSVKGHLLPQVLQTNEIVAAEKYINQ
ncbi:MAG: DEAD/DEAH box helicase family protein [Prevotella sp.]|nr:DEAD/DEAH box helicase family protein [Prevotella sp.]